MKKSITLIICFLCNQHFTFAESPAYPEKGYQRYFVGEFGERWQFPSDHLPRGATIGHFHIAFWNILNKDYLHHIEKNTQGLRDSSILKDNVPCSGEDSSSLTIREYKIALMVLEMLTHPTHPRSVIALQETHPDVQNLLAQLLPAKWAMATPPEQPLSQDIFIYDTQLFDVVGVEAVRYSSDRPKTIFTLTLQEKATGEYYRFIQSHIPGGSANGPEGCRKFAEEALRQFDESRTVILMGDMNQSPDVIDKALAVVAMERGLPFSPYWYMHVKYPSHIDTKMEAAWIDNFFIYAPSKPDTTEIIRATQNPKNLLEAAVPMVKLLSLVKNSVGYDVLTHCSD
jgi:hypothetical protein